MSNESKHPIANSTRFPVFENPSLSVVPAALIKPTPKEIEICTAQRADSVQSLADLTIEPVQQWVHLPTGEDTTPQLVAVLCTVCYNRFNTPGTIYYKNQTLLTQCLATCT